MFSLKVNWCSFWHRKLPRFRYLSMVRKGEQSEAVLPRLQVEKLIHRGDLVLKTWPADSIYGSYWEYTALCWLFLGIEQPTMRVSISWNTSTVFLYFTMSNILLLWFFFNKLLPYYRTRFHAGHLILRLPLILQYWLYTVVLPLQEQLDWRTQVCLTEGNRSQLRHTSLASHNGKGQPAMSTSCYLLLDLLSNWKKKEKKATGNNGYVMLAHGPSNNPGGRLKKRMKMSVNR